MSTQTHNDFIMNTLWNNSMNLFYRCTIYLILTPIKPTKRQKIHLHGQHRPPPCWNFLHPLGQEAYFRNLSSSGNFYKKWRTHHRLLPQFKNYTLLYTVVLVQSQLYGPALASYHYHLNWHREWDTFGSRLLAEEAHQSSETDEADQPYLLKSASPWTWHLSSSTSPYMHTWHDPSFQQQSWRCTENSHIF